MGFARKDLVAVGDKVVLDTPHERDSRCTLQYISGAGTVVLEGICSEAAVDDIDANWFPISMTKPDTTVVASLLAAGIGHAENVYAKVRARKTLGGASCIVVIGVTE